MNPGGIVSPSANSSEVSSQSTRPSLRAMNPSRLATMWMVTQESASDIAIERPAYARHVLLLRGSAKHDI